jgi:hypothetical protein
MGLSLVRCPFCDRRYNVTGIPPGTRVLCTSCRTVLTVPGNRFVAPPPFWHRFVPRSGAAQAAYTVFGGLILAAGAVCLVALREGQAPRPEVASSTGNHAPAPAPKADEPRDVPVLNVSPNLRKILADYQQDARFQIHASEELKPFVLVGERNSKADLPVVFSQFEDLLPKLYRTFMSEFGAPLKLEPIEGWELPIVFYTRRETYDAWWQRVYRKPSIQEVYGVFSYLERRVNLYYDLSLDSIDAGRTREVLLHEAIHQLVDHYSRRHKKADNLGAWWFQEGLGNYFEGFSLFGDEVETSAGKMTSRLPLARELLTTRAADYEPLKKLITWDVNAIWESLLKDGSEEAKRQVEKLQCHYAQAWAFVHFLRHAQDGKYRPFFNEYFRSELEGQGGMDELKRLLNLHHPGVDLDKLDAEFQEYLRQL